MLILARTLLSNKTLDVLKREKLWLKCDEIEAKKRRRCCALTERRVSTLLQAWPVIGHTFHFIIILPLSVGTYNV